MILQLLLEFNQNASIDCESSNRLLNIIGPLTDVHIHLSLRWDWLRYAGAPELGAQSESGLKLLSELFIEGDGLGISLLIMFYIFLTKK